MLSILLVIYIYIYFYIRVVRRSLNLLRASFSQYFSAVNVTRGFFSPVFQYFVTYVCICIRIRICICVCHAPRNCIVGHRFSTLNSSAMDSSAIGVGVAVLVGKCMQGP